MVSNDSNIEEIISPTSRTLVVTLPLDSLANSITNKTREVMADESLTVSVVIFCIIVLIIGLAGNLLVLIVFGSRYKKLKACEIFMISLAVADLIGTIVVPTKTFLELLEHSFDPIGDIGCKVISFFSMASLSVSAITLVLISIDRFLIVKWPLRKRPEFKTICYVILISWILGSSFGLVYFGENIKLFESTPGIKTCRDFGSIDEILKHIIPAMTIQIFIPIAVITVLYSLIIYELRNSERTKIFEHHQRIKQIRLRQNKRATILLVVIVAVFYVCVTPINVAYLIYLHDSIPLSDDQIAHLLSALSMLQMINSCANPIIYSKLHTSFRRTTLRLLCSCCFQKFKGYRWGSLGESFRYALTTSISMRSKRSSRGSLGSNRDFSVSTRFDSKSLEDLNHNRNGSQLTSESPLQNCMQTSLNTSTYVNKIKAKDSSSNEELLQKQLSDGDDSVFQGKQSERKDSLKPLMKFTKNHLSKPSFESKIKFCKKKKFKNAHTPIQDKRFLSPSMSVAYESPIAVEKRHAFAKQRYATTDLNLVCSKEKVDS